MIFIFKLFSILYHVIYQHVIRFAPDILSFFLMIELVWSGIGGRIVIVDINYTVIEQRETATGWSAIGSDRTAAVVSVNLK